MDKFKNDIQHKFNQREIQPTEEAWGKITGELASSRTRKTKGLWLWSGIAAGFIGLLVLLSPAYFSVSTDEGPVVNSEEKQTQEMKAERPVIVSVIQLQPKAIKASFVQFPKSKLRIEAPKSISSSTLKPKHLKAKTLLAEVEQELEEERFRQQNLSEMDALLAQARADLSTKRDKQIFDQLSAESLLAEVDTDTNGSFKDKIWKLIEVNFNELKSSLGAR
ncbi:hypothetical protein [Psychroflexus sediminis]|uniref:Uncharacterized protein n=1 Tax=Psychroflexus sediminis TaxID=470826 RepID=A0A1G7V9D7_9FLAO|nr:hypothetical protein [Psychroflexus sediminis]SDG56422.1 hypothetical protein SAMN04488027_103172 [Psychroflexus sediminis]